MGSLSRTLGGRCCNDVTEFLVHGRHTLLNASVEWQPVAERDVSLVFGVCNITDEEARSHTSFLKDLLPQPGRNVRFALVAGF
ncbi:TonB-dependent receptor [Maricaulaceae bacterium NA33B04]|nr:TonB-dependent receptor [Maricaulaceae bacterium NA33B04]